MADNEPIVIIGGGIGGLCTAIWLAINGESAVLFEKNQAIGGKVREFHQDGFRWDMGPGFITMRDLYEEIFKAAGKRLGDHLQLLPVDPISKYFFQDGTHLEIRRDLSRTLENIALVGEQHVEEYLSFLAFSSRQYRLVESIFTLGPSTIPGYIRRVGLANFFKTDLFRDFNSAIEENTTSKHLRQVFGYLATKMGSNPFMAPAVLSMVAHIELSKGVWYPRGGMYSIAQALERLAIEKGVTIHTKSPVKQIVVQEREVRGIVLEDGTAIESGTVVSNIDYAGTYASLLPNKPPYSWESENYKKLPASPSAFILLLGIKGKYSELAQNNILFSGDCRKEFDQIYRQKVLPDDPTVSISITSKTDMAHAPIGHENWLVMVNVPPVDAKIDWLSQAQNFKKTILHKIAGFGFDLKDKIVSEKFIAPLDIEAMTGGYRGSIYGTTYDSWRSFVIRPQLQAKTPKGLFFVGGSTFPGNGTPMALKSARILAEIITEKQPA